MIYEKQIFENCCNMLNRVSNYFLVWIWYTSMFIYYVKFNFLSEMLEGLEQKKAGSNIANMTRNNVLSGTFKALLR